MKGYIYNDTKDITYTDLDMPEAGPDDVVVKVKLAGICGSDLTAWNDLGILAGVFPDWEFGHEMVCEVYEVGENITDIAVGDRVWVNPMTCKTGGLLMADVCGAFSEYVLVEEAKWGYNLWRLPESLTWDDCVIVEPFGVGMHAVNRCDPKPGDNIVIYGEGTIGLMATCACIGKGLKPIVLGLSDARLKVAEEMGAITCNTEGMDSDAKLAWLCETCGTVTNSLDDPVPNVQAFIDAAGAPIIQKEVLMWNIEYCKLIVVAVHKHPIEVNFRDIMSGQYEIRGSRGYEAVDIDEVFEDLLNPEIKAGLIVTHRFPHDKLEEAFEVASDLKNGPIKVIIDYDME